MVTTGTVSEANGGPINFFVVSGSGYIPVNTPRMYYAAGVIVVDQCFDTIFGFQVSNDSGDTWEGSIKLSMDEKNLLYVGMF